MAIRIVRSRSTPTGAVFEISVGLEEEEAMRRLLGALELMPERLSAPIATSTRNTKKKNNPARRLKELRHERGITQIDLAKALGTVQARISNYEKGTRPIPHELAIEMAQFFKVDPQELFYEDESLNVK